MLRGVIGMPSLLRSSALSSRSTRQNSSTLLKCCTRQRCPTLLGSSTPVRTHTRGYSDTDDTKDGQFADTVFASIKNMYIRDRRREVGFDLNCACWLIRNGVRVRFSGHDDFITEQKQLPLLEDVEVMKEYILEEIDADSSSTLMHRGMEFFEGCQGLKFIRFLNCPYIDDRALTAMGEITTFKYRLEALELLCCWDVTANGLMHVAEFENLKYLKVVDLPEIKDASILRFLRASLPNCEFDFQNIG